LQMQQQQQRAHQEAQQQQLAYQEAQQQQQQAFPGGPASPDCGASQRNGRSRAGNGPRSAIAGPGLAIGGTIGASNP
jgi:type II secretory pathway pseudopilin PulG